MGLTPVVSQTGVRFLADTPARIGSFLAWLACATLLYSTVVSSLAAGVLLVALGALTACYPVGGVLVSAALVPIVGAAFAAFAGQGGEWAEAIVLATIAGFMLRRSAGLERWPSGGAARWAAVFAAAVLASAVVQLAVIRVLLSPPLFWTTLGELTRTYLQGPVEVGNPVRPALLLLEGVAIVMIIAALRRVPGTPERVLHMFVAGACGAAALNLSRMAGAVLRSEAPVAALAALLRSVRISVPFADVNAAGSFFAMAVGVAAGFAATTSGRTRAAWLGAAALCAAALLTTGSRTAILAAFFFVLVATLVRLGRVRALRFALLACAVGALAVVVLPNPLAGRNTSDALNMRVELARAAGRMIEVKPFFGIGIGQFYSRSGQFIHRPQGRPMYIQENAHNNFLQIGGELGLVGLDRLRLDALLHCEARDRASALDGNVAGALRCRGRTRRLPCDLPGGSPAAHFGSRAGVLGRGRCNRGGRARTRRTVTSPTATGDRRRDCDRDDDPVAHDQRGRGNQS